MVSGDTDHHCSRQRFVTSWAKVFLQTVTWGFQQTKFHSSWLQKWVAYPYVSFRDAGCDCCDKYDYFVLQSCLQTNLYFTFVIVKPSRTYININSGLAPFLIFRGQELSEHQRLRHPYRPPLFYFPFIIQYLRKNSYADAGIPLIKALLLPYLNTITLLSVFKKYPTIMLSAECIVLQKN